ncbi:hypothetical protein Ancab_004353 [Ancistrocladus abbreviatus]
MIQGKGFWDLLVKLPPLIRGEILCKYRDNTFLKLWKLYVMQREFMVLFMVEASAAVICVNQTLCYLLQPSQFFVGGVVIEISPTCSGTNYEISVHYSEDFLIVLYFTAGTISV